MTGVIFDLKRFAIHDGAGLRTTLFLKGCPLRCPWCQNPEGLHMNVELRYAPSECLHCGSCAAVCPQDALSLDTHLHIDKAKCNACGMCEDVCPAGALKLAGETITSEKAAEMLLRDRVFFGEKGGVTLSGGEVLLQWKFAEEILRICKDAGVDTAIETCLFASDEALEAMLPVTDHFIIDIKLFDSDTHLRLLGADNQIILRNFRWLIKQNADVLVRTPLIPGFTANDNNIRAIAEFIHRTAPEVSYELLNFNPLCRSKYSAMEQNYPVVGGALSDLEMEHFYHILEEVAIARIIKE